MAQIVLSADDRLILKSALDLAGLSQKAIAERAGVTQSWMSQVMTGVRSRRIDSEMLERIAEVLVDQIKDSPVDEDRKRVILTFLSRFAERAAALIPPKAHRPGDRVPVDARHYVNRFADIEVLNALKEPPITLLVTGPVQCGKSSVLLRLEHKAREIGIETAWFDPRLPVTSPTSRATQQLDIISFSAALLSEQLQAQWNLKPPREGVTDTIPKLCQWLARALEPSGTKLRLLIMDDLSRLGARASWDWLSQFVRWMHNERATSGLRVDLAIGLTHQFGVSYARKLLNVNSVVHWFPMIDLGWLERSEVSEMFNKLSSISGKGTSDSRADYLYDLFLGQPFLTHAAMVDEKFLNAVLNWSKNPAENQAIRETLPYRRHLSAIRFAIAGPVADKESENLRKAFVSVCLENRLPDENQRLFLRRAWLLNREGGPMLPLYRLIAEDIQSRADES